jgi:hypothetical protein
MTVLASGTTTVFDSNVQKPMAIPDEHMNHNGHRQVYEQFIKALDAAYGTQEPNRFQRLFDASKQSIPLLQPASGDEKRGKGFLDDRIEMFYHLGDFSSLVLVVDDRDLLRRKTCTLTYLREHGLVGKVKDPDNADHGAHWR